MVTRAAPDGRRDEYSAKDIAMAVRRLDVLLSNMELDTCDRLGVSPGELLALAHLSLNGALGPTDLTRRLHMTTGAMTAMLDRLAEGGFIVREPHPTDRRRVRVRLTATGRDRVFSQVHEMADGIVAMNEEFSAAERCVVGRYLDRLSQVIAASAAGQPDQGR